MTEEEEMPLNTDLVEYIDEPFVMPCKRGKHFYVKKSTLHNMAPDRVKVSCAGL